VEVEAKFKAPTAEVLQVLGKIPELAGLPLAGGVRAEVTDTYFDTEQWLILAGGFYCRARRLNGRTLITLKQVDGGGEVIHRREEYEVELAEFVQPYYWPEGPARRRVLALVGARPLRGMLELRQVRTTRLIGDPEHPLAELSLDVVSMGDGTESPDGVVTFYEVEVELKEAGSEEDLSVLAGELCREWSLEPETRSKFQRALDVIRRFGGVETATSPAVFGAVEASPSPVVGEIVSNAENVIDAATVATAGVAVANPAVTAAAEAATGAVAGTAAEAAAGVAAAAAGTVDGAAECIEAVECPGDELKAVGSGHPKSKSGRAAKRSFLGDGLEVLERPGLTVDDTMAEAARKTLLYHLQRMMHHEPGTRDGEDPEELHDMRVATRRMRAALCVFGGHVDMEAYRPFRKAMRETGRELGAVRDLDVFMIKTQAYVDSLAPESRTGLDLLAAAWQAERDRARAELLVYLDSGRYQQFKAKFEAFLRTPGAAAPRTRTVDGGPAPVRVGDVLPGVLFDRLALVKAYDGPISEVDAPLEVFHELRITAKAMRYTLEFFSEVLGPDVKRLVDRIKDVQDHLGDLQDAVVTSDVLLGFLASGEWGLKRAEKSGRRPLYPMNAPGVATYLAVKQQEIERLMRTFGPLWERIHGSEFSRPLARLIVNL
jgi:CHAD domain-containing protein